MKIPSTEPVRRRIPRRAAGIAAMAALISSLLSAAPAVADTTAVSATGESILLNEGDQPGIERPVLDGIKQSAAEKGIPLEEAVATYISEAAAKLPANPESQPDGPVDTPDITIDDLTAGELEDLQAMAESDGITLEESIDRNGWQDSFIEVSGELEATFPGEFSGAVKAEDGSSAWFAFKGDIPAEAIELAQSLPVPVEVVGNRGFSEAELADAKETAHQAVIAREDVVDATTAYDIQAGEINVQAQILQPLKSDKVRAAVAQSVTSALDVPGGGFTVTVNVVRENISDAQDQYVRGGGSLSVGCTSGFNLKQISGSTKRLGTAGHCTRGSSQTYSNHSVAGGSTSVSTVWSHEGSWGDIGYTTTGSKSGTRTFYQDRNSTRYADDRGSMPAVGTSICKFGMTSGKSCGKVRHRDVSAGSLRHMVIMSNTSCQGGDSGGPWFKGGTAYGIHFGLIASSDGTYRCSFTPAYLFQNRGYDVWTR